MSLSGPGKGDTPRMTVVNGQLPSGRTRGYPLGPRAVELRVPARTELLAVVRMVTGALASYEGLDGDSTADLALAVDEACTVLITLAAAGSTLVLVEDPGVSAVNVQVSAVCDAPENDPANITLSGFSRRVLEALTDEVDTFSEGADGSVFGISLTSRRGWASTGG